MEQVTETVKASSKRADEVVLELGTDPEKGLTSAEAEARLGKYGENSLGEAEKESFLGALAEEAREPMILLLLFVGVLYSLWGSILDAVTIFTVIAILVLSEVYNEYRAEQGMESLRKLASLTSLVVRDGQVKEVPTTDLVPGDILPLSVGGKIPADARLIKSYGLQIDESSLTGESMPVRKDASAVLPEGSQVTDLSNMVLTGTLIVQGEGLSVVTSTGRGKEKCQQYKLLRGLRRRCSRA